MGDAKNKLEYEIKATLEESIAVLESLTKGLRDREVLLRHRGEAVELHPSSVVSLAVKAKQKGIKETIEIELSWKRDAGLSAGPEEDLQIGSVRRRHEGDE